MSQMELVTLQTCFINRWKECDYGSDYSWLRRKGNCYQQKYLTTTVYTDWL